MTNSLSEQNNLIRNEAFDLAFRFINETGENIFLTGKAGTGKTTFLKFLREHSTKKIVVAAPTGVAAINAGGITLHSLFQLPFAPYIPGDASLLSKLRYGREKLNLLRNIEVLIIDEASMVPCHNVDAIDTILKSIRRNHNLPFGGVQLLFIGDLHQLPPVAKKEEWEILKNFYDSIFFFDSLVLRSHIPNMIELKEIYRQKDPQFIDVLNEIRNNNLSSEKAALLSSRIKPEFQPEDNDGYITLTTHNQQADSINQKKLESKPNNSYSYSAAISGDFPEHMYPCDRELILKENAQVMFIKNDPEKKYFNGKTGIITYLSGDMIKVKCGKEQEITVKKLEWQNINYSLNPETRGIVENVLGSFEQYPLRLAWAITIHKSQGLTFDKVIIDSENAFATGQVYVALSRCTSLDGLVLTSPFNRKFLGAHQNLINWINANGDESGLSEKFQQARQKFTIVELQAIFNWKSWTNELYELSKLINENSDDLPPAAIQWIEEILNSQRKLNEIAIKFNQRILQLVAENKNVEDNQALQQRIKDAANYFINELTKWRERFLNHPVRAQTKKVAKPIDICLEKISIILNELMHKTELCKKGFFLSQYLCDGKKVQPVQNKPRSSFLGKKSKSGQSITAHATLFNMISKFRKDKASLNKLPAYLILSNSDIINVCEFLPANSESLLNIKGFGSAKVSLYGDKVIELVQRYCRQNNLVPKVIVKGISEIAKKGFQPDSFDETLRLFKERKSIEQIAAERNFAVSTIEDHLAKAIKISAIQIEEVIPMEDVLKLVALFPVPIDREIRLSEIKQKAPENVSYGRIKMVLAWLQRK